MSTPLAIVIEDESALRVIYDRILGTIGYEVLMAPDGEIALQLVSEYTPSLIFLDMLLPKVNGLDVLQHIRSQAHLADTYVVVVSSAKEYQRHVQEFEHAEFMQKPVLPTDIREIAARVLKAAT